MVNARAAGRAIERARPSARAPAIHHPLVRVVVKSATRACGSSARRRPPRPARKCWRHGTPLRTYSSSPVDAVTLLRHPGWGAASGRPSAATASTFRRRRQPEARECVRTVAGRDGITRRRRAAGVGGTRFRRRRGFVDGPTSRLLTPCHRGQSPERRWAAAGQIAHAPTRRNLVRAGYTKEEGAQRDRVHRSRRAGRVVQVLDKGLRENAIGITLQPRHRSRGKLRHTPRRTLLVRGRRRDRRTRRRADCVVSSRCC